MNTLCPTAADVPQALGAWLSRSSVSPKKLHGPGPDAVELGWLLRAALSGPDHGRLRPCSLTVLDAGQRQRLSAAFETCKRERCGPLDADAARIEHERALLGPCLIAVTAQVREGLSRVPAYEQWIAVGAVVGNLLTAANALGYAGKMLSGDRVHAEAVRSLLCAPGEVVVGFVYLGRVPTAQSGSRMEPVNPPVPQVGVSARAP